MNYNLLNSGDRILTITSDFIAIERNDGSVDLYKLTISKECIYFDIEHPTTIGYSNESVDPITDSYETESGVRIINF
ncbi:MAG: hypothetical protein ACK5LL_16775 [Suipraeoptans sp.]